MNEWTEGMRDNSAMGRQARDQDTEDSRSVMSCVTRASHPRSAPPSSPPREEEARNSLL